MAMFDLEDVDKAKLNRCTTDSEKILKARRLGELEATDCEAAIRPRDAQISRWRKAASWCVEHIMQILIGLAVAGICAYLGLK